jgi:hypothetical protein
VSNYCFQQITALGAQSDIEEFIKFVQAEKAFNVAALAAKLGVEAPESAWSLDVIADEPGRIVYEFETEWEEDQVLVPALAAKFPALKVLHEYAEPNMVFGGCTEFVNGEVAFAAHSDDFDTFRFRTEPWVTEFLQFWFTEGE